MSYCSYGQERDSVMTTREDYPMTRKEKRAYNIVSGSNPLINKLFREKIEPTLPKGDQVFRNFTDTVYLDSGNEYVQDLHDGVYRGPDVFDGTMYSLADTTEAGIIERIFTTVHTEHTRTFVQPIYTTTVITLRNDSVTKIVSHGPYKKLFIVLVVLNIFAILYYYLRQL